MSTIAAAIRTIISGGIAERARFGPQLIATAVLAGVACPQCAGADLSADKIGATPDREVSG